MLLLFLTKTILLLLLLLLLLLARTRILWLRLLIPLLIKLLHIGNFRTIGNIHSRSEHVSTCRGIKSPRLHYHTGRDVYRPQFGLFKGTLSYFRQLTSGFEEY